MEGDFPALRSPHPVWPRRPEAWAELKPVGSGVTGSCPLPPPLPVSFLLSPRPPASTSGLGCAPLELEAVCGATSLRTGLWVLTSCDGKSNDCLIAS